MRPASRDPPGLRRRPANYARRKGTHLRLLRQCSAANATAACDPEGAMSRLDRARRRRDHALTFPIEVSFRRAPIELSASGLSHDREWSRQQRPVSRDDLTVKKDQLARRMSSDGFGDTARGDGK